MNCRLSKGDDDLLVMALDSRRAEFTSRLKVLNLSKNNINFKTLAGVIGNNTTIESLDISKNNMGVAGAKYFA